MGLTTSGALALGSAVAFVTALTSGALMWGFRQAYLTVTPRMVGPGDAAFYQVITVGVRDDQVTCQAHAGGPELIALNAAYSNAGLLGISPTTLATSGRYFGADAVVLQFNVLPDGVVELRDVDCNYYEAAKQAGALAVLADVVQLDADGKTVSRRRTHVRLL